MSRCSLHPRSPKWRVFFSQIERASGLNNKQTLARTILLALGLSKLPMRWVYSLSLASLAVFAWIDGLFWFSQKPSRWLCWQNSPFSSSVVRSWQLRREVGSYFSTDGDDKYANVFIQLDGWEIFNFLVFVLRFQKSFRESYISFSFFERYFCFLVLK